MHVIETVRFFFFQSVLLQLLKAALVWTNHKLSEAKLWIHLLFMRTKLPSNGWKRTLWKKKRVQVSDLYDNKWQKNLTEKDESTNSMIKHVNYKHKEYFRYVSMISFFMFVISMAFICYAVHVSPILFCMDVLLTQYF